MRATEFYFVIGKRVTDITLTILFILFFSWLFVIIFFGYILTWKFPIIYESMRIGSQGVPFTMYKFRTLLVNEQLPLENRRFWIGSLLRLTNLDELPQLWNVLKGEMSLVGPRPLPVEYAPYFTQTQMKRHSVRPGITGWAQVNGKNSLSWEQKFNFDLQYVDQNSFFTDITILLKTITLVLSMKRDVSLLEEKFSGQS